MFRSVIWLTIFFLLGWCASVCSCYGQTQFQLQPYSGVGGGYNFGQNINPAFLTNPGLTMNPGWTLPPRDGMDHNWMLLWLLSQQQNKAPCPGNMPQPIPIPQPVSYGSSGIDPVLLLLLLQNQQRAPYPIPFPQQPFVQPCPQQPIILPFPDGRHRRRW